MVKNSPTPLTPSPPPARPGASACPPPPRVVKRDWKGEWCKMYEPTEIDFQILNYISCHGPASLSQLVEAFPSVSAVEYRVCQLAAPEYRSVAGMPEEIPNTSYLVESYRFADTDLGKTTEYLGIYTLSERGKKAVQDHSYRTKSARKELWLKNAWIPILVTLAANLLVLGIKWLLPLIQEWLPSILQRIFS